jgi:hypothetical protein
MKLAKYLAVASMLASLMMNTGTAYAKRDRREGFNFGTSVRIISSDDKAYGNATDGIDGGTKTQSQSYNPFVAYSTGLLNVGLTAHIESTQSSTREHQNSTGQIVDRQSSSDLKGTSLFGRFLFGKVMFFELGMGLYKQNVNVDNQYTNVSAGGSFNGQRDTYKVESAGPGYHLGGGLELPIADGFYFTTSYLVRIYQLRDISSGTLGEKRAYEQKRELTFGVEHYLN